MALPNFAYLLLSGGLDSVTLLYELLASKVRVHALLVNYGQKHVRELYFASTHCIQQGISKTMIDLHRITGIFKRSALTDGESDSVIVPNRNMVFLSVAASMAASAGADEIFVACNKDDAAIFPDCRPEFIAAMNRAVAASGTSVFINAPFLETTKKEIVQRGRALNIDFSQTYSCYVGQREPCGECLACKLRAEALA